MQKERALVPQDLLPRLYSYTWHSSNLESQARQRLQAALTAWTLGTQPSATPDQVKMRDQAIRQLDEYSRLLLQDYLASHGARVSLGDHPGRGYPLKNTQMILPVDILRLTRALRLFPFPEIFDFKALEAKTEFLIGYERGSKTFYLKFPFLGQTWLVRPS